MEFAIEHGLVVSLRTVERACAPAQGEYNAIAGRDSANREALEAHLVACKREVAYVGGLRPLG